MWVSGHSKEGICKSILTNEMEKRMVGIVYRPTVIKLGI
jgi:hypothetical protein